MKIKLLFFSFIISIFFSISCSTKSTENNEPVLRDAFADKFLVGTALSNRQITGKDTASINLAVKQFNAVTAENDMKWERIHPQPNKYNFAVADSLIELAEKNNMKVIGHTLVWHAQTPTWVFEDADGVPTTRDTLLKRMKEHIFSVVGRYKGKVHGWDVVNEAFEDNGTFRQTPWFKIIGEDFIQKAFEYAHEADPSAELYYNDFSLTIDAKRKGVIQLINKLKEQGVRVDGIGMQAHYGVDKPTLKEIENSILEYSATGTQVMLTELDISVLPFPEFVQGADISQLFKLTDENNPYVSGLPDSVETAQINKYVGIFNICLEHSDKISRVTLWGVNDQQSWKNNWPVPGRTDYALLFDRNNKPKKVTNLVLQLTENKN